MEKLESRPRGFTQRDLWDSRHVKAALAGHAVSKGQELFVLAGRAWVRMAPVHCVRIGHRFRKLADASREAE